MIETLLGGLLGGAFRLAPEILEWLDRKGERGHELAMQDKALEFEKLRRLPPHLSPHLPESFRTDTQEPALVRTATWQPVDFHEAGQWVSDRLAGHLTSQQAVFRPALAGRLFRNACTCW